MSPRIQILPDSLVNRIAAGEVIERPASIVKELIDNAIDAGSARITVRLEEGGKGLISVSDDGEGMFPDDAVLAFQRYATSKLTAESDLEKIATLGFRGEALPSIASVSGVLLTSRREEGTGVELLLEEGKIVRKREIARGRGTEIQVRDLFANFPARQKFLKSGQAELAASNAMVNQLALAHPRIGFELFHQGKRLFQYSGVPLFRDRILQVYGEEILDRLLPIEKERDSFFSLEGFISLPPHAFPGRGYQELFVNRRPVKNATVHHAVYEAFGSYLMKGQNPFYVFLLEVDPSRVDVNVHPAKKEVRFPDTSFVHRKIYERVREALRERSGGASPDSEGVVDTAQTGETGAFPRKEPGRESLEDYMARSHSREPGFFSETPDIFRSEGGEAGAADDFRVLGQFRDMFLLVQEGDGLQIIDQHAAHERVLYERLLIQLSRTSIPVQPFLVPRQVTVSQEEMALFGGLDDFFGQLGFEIDPFGERTLLVRAAPAFLAQSDLTGLISDLMEEAASFNTASSDRDKFEKMIATMACHGSVRAGQPLGEQEISSLFRDLAGTEGALTCPHGRPIRKIFTVKELEKLFHRI